MLSDSVRTQSEMAIGARPSSSPGTTSSSVQAMSSFGRLISTRRPPASESMECCLVLDTSVSTSPRRGSMNGFPSALRLVRLFISAHEISARFA